MRQDFLQDGVFEGFAEFGIIVAINGIGGCGDLAIGESGKEKAALLGEPFGQLGAEALHGTTMASEKDDGWDAGGLAA